MAPISLSLFLSRPHHTPGYKALEGVPYTDDFDASSSPSHAHSPTLSSTLLCPRYAENDTSSAPPSPASIESFDVLDSVAWRRGYAFTSGSGRGEGRPRRNCDAVRKRWRKNRALVVAVMVVLALLVLGGVLGAVFAARWEERRVVGVCLQRGGMERCVVREWARCVARNGMGFCEGVL